MTFIKRILLSLNLKIKNLIFFSLLLGKFQWVDTTINLNGICNVTQICPIGGNKELDHIHVVIGQRILPENNRVYGFALYEQVDSEQPSPINMINLAKLESQLSLFNRTGIHLNTLEQGGSIMMGPFWPSSNGNYIIY